MSKESLIATVQSIFRDVLDNPTFQLQEPLTATDVEGWDSLTHLSIITAIEKQYGIRFTLGELDSFGNIGDLLAMIDKKRPS